jgi:hypothetical protein
MFTLLRSNKYLLLQYFDNIFKPVILWYTFGINMVIVLGKIPIGICDNYQETQE